MNDSPSTPPKPAGPGVPPARFVTGSTMRHVIEVTVTGSVGLIAIFFVDFLSLFYISRLDDDRLTAGVGYATSLLYVAISINVGSMIAGIALVSRRIGAGDRDGARRLAASSVVLTGLVAAALSVVLLAILPWLLPAMGAEGVPLDIAQRFLWITLPANVLMGVSMSLSGLLRAVGDPRRAMNVTLFGGIVTAIVDPLLIFGAGLGTDGAAIATVIARLVYIAVAWHGVVKVHGLLTRPRLPDIRSHARPFFDIAGPAILTNVATPISVLFLMRVLAPFGAPAIAASAIIDRLVPLAFGALFALSGAVGPIFGQNFGARRYDRLRSTLRDAFLFAIGYCLIAWLLLVLLRHQIALLFGVEGETARYVAFFCIISGATWIFNGFLFVANAAFNNLGYPLYSTAFNWGRATLGTIPFAWAGAQFGGVEGAMLGVALGSVLFGVSASLVAFGAINRIGTGEHAAGRA